MMNDVNSIENLLRQAIEKIDPRKPIDASDPRYVDLSELRGEAGRICERMYKRIKFSNDNNLTFIVTGHGGSGKSTELRTFSKKLEKNNYVVVYFSVEHVINMEDVDTPDILLAIAYQIDHQLRERNMAIPEEKLEQLLDWFNDVVYEKMDRKQLEGEVRTAAKIGADIPLIGGLLAQITGRFRSVSDWKMITRNRINQRLSDFTNLMNELIVAATEQIEKKEYKELVVIIDDLEKLRWQKLETRSNHEKIFSDDAEILCSLKCTTVYTVPLSLLCSNLGTVVRPKYAENFMLPMAKLVDRFGEENTQNIKTFIKIAEKRIPEGLSFQDSDALKRIALFSGGNVKEFVRLLSYIFYEVNLEDFPFPNEIIEQTFRKWSREFDRSVPAADYAKLAEIAETHRIDPDSGDHQRMIHSLYVLHYVNHSDWYNVNPAIKTLPLFKTAVDERREVMRDNE